jgi:hypothetical protein
MLADVNPALPSARNRDGDQAILTIRALVHSERLARLCPSSLEGHSHADSWDQR